MPKPLDVASRNTIAAAASRLLADSYTLYLKTHNYHWNVKGPMFTTLHTLFELEYTELALAVDEIAERIRALGHAAPGSYTAFAKLSKVKEAGESVPPAIKMIEKLAADQDLVVSCARDLFAVASAADDQASADLATRRILIHEKNAWMLRSHLE
jgi:starvation-inducible DNA-binding protein